MKQKIDIGAILEININKDYYVYAQILGKSGYAFFNYKSKTKIKNLLDLKKSSVLFIVSVYNDVITKGHWKIVGKLPIREELQTQPMKFIQDAINSNEFSLYDPNTGEIKESSKEECKGLERSAVYEAEHIEERIKNYYEGVPNKYRKIDLDVFN